MYNELDSLLNFQRNFYGYFCLKVLQLRKNDPLGATSLRGLSLSFLSILCSLFYAQQGPPTDERVFMLR